MKKVEEMFGNLDYFLYLCTVNEDENEDEKLRYEDENDNEKRAGQS